MTLLAIPQTSNVTPSTTDPPRRAAERERKQLNKKAWASPDKGCLRCGGLMVSGDTSSLERDAAGKPMTVWRCVNCGDCVDHRILANREKSSGSARVCARPPIGSQ